MKKIIVAIFMAFSLSACQADPVISLEDGVQTHQFNRGRIEIFKGDRLHGYSSSGLEEFEWEHVPKREIRRGDVTLWMFYEEGDEDTRQQLEDYVEQLKTNDLSVESTE